MVEEEFHPYIMFLPTKEKFDVLKTIFGSEVPAKILEFSISKGVSKKIFQKELVKKLTYSNKTIIEHLKTLVNLGIVTEHMEKKRIDNRVVWVKYYLLSEVGRWFALLLAEEKLTKEEKSRILCNIFRAYIRWVKRLSAKLDVPAEILRKIFKEELG